MILYHALKRSTKRFLGRIKELCGKVMNFSIEHVPKRDASISTIRVIIGRMDNQPFVLQIVARDVPGKKKKKRGRRKRTWQKQEEMLRLPQAGCY
jgi:hypothetical protein